jgi:hypothetical protein
MVSIHNDISPNYPTLTPTLSLRERELVKCKSSLPFQGRIRVGMGYNHDAIYVAVYKTRFPLKSCGNDNHVCAIL